MSLVINARRLGSGSFLILALLAWQTTAASAERPGKSTDFASPHGLSESCVAIADMPGAVYSAADRATESAYCAIDFYAKDVALCPKIWSTSPGTLVYDVSQGDYAADASRFEAKACGRGGQARKLAHRELAVYKQSMNAVDTSATYSTASLLYYHFSRYFQASSQVPVAVYRTMDRRLHHDRVARRGLQLTAGKKSLRMIHAGWQHFTEAEENSGAKNRDLFTDDKSQIYGVLLMSSGRRYSEAVNGTRESGWGKGQNLDFQQTAPYLALRNAQPLPAAIEAGVNDYVAKPYRLNTLNEKAARLLGGK